MGAATNAIHFGHMWLHRCCVQRAVWCHPDRGKLKKRRRGRVCRRGPGSCENTDSSHSPHPVPTRTWFSRRPCSSDELTLGQELCGISPSTVLLPRAGRAGQGPFLQARPQRDGSAAWIIAALVRGRAQVPMLLGVAPHLPPPGRGPRLAEQSPQPVCVWIHVADFLFRFNTEV